MNAIPSPYQGSHSFFQIENQAWGFGPLTESASDCSCSNYSCVVPLGPAPGGSSHQQLPTLEGVSCMGGEGGRAVEALVNPSDLQVWISEALRPKWGMSCPRTQLGNGRDSCRAWSSMLLELKGEVWTERGGAVKAGGSWPDQGGLIARDEGGMKQN